MTTQLTLPAHPDLNHLKRNRPSSCCATYGRNGARRFKAFLPSIPDRLIL
jgi:hypothetical protein